MTNATKIIGLTGNIATGKSVVRRMLANSGALGIDADEIAHRMLFPGSPAYQSVRAAFGEEILSADGKISRTRLGEIVFRDEGKLQQLEKLIHPGVVNAIKKRIHKTTVPIIVIEAIKLLESDLRELCDSIWVSHASTARQMERLVQTRDMSEQQALERIAAQPPQKEKLAYADIVINTESAFKETWKEVQKSLNDTIQSSIDIRSLDFNITKNWTGRPAGSLPAHQLEGFWKESGNESNPALYVNLGMQMLLPLFRRDQLTALILWNNRHYLGLIDLVFPEAVFQQHAPEVLEAVRLHALQQQCEVLLFPAQLTLGTDIQPEVFGFENNNINNLHYPGWQQSAKEIAVNGQNEYWMKILMQPIEAGFDLM